MSAFLDAFSGPGGIFMYLILMVLAYALTIFCERLWLFGRVWSMNLGAARAAIKQADYQTAEAQLGAHPAARLLEAAQSTSSTKNEDLWNAMATEAPLVEEQVYRRLNGLSAAANIATMLGLLGTVYGLIYALEGLDDASTIERTARLSAGIAAAMTTTAWGLVVGVPALLAHSILSSKAERVLAESESLAAEMVTSFAHKSSNQP